MRKPNKEKKKLLDYRSKKLLYRKSHPRKKRKYEFNIHFQTLQAKNEYTTNDIWAPSSLTLKYENCVEVIRFINRIKKAGNKGSTIDLHLEDVDEIGEGAISMLLSVISELETRGVYFYGHKPKKEIPKNILERSGFFAHMQGQVSSKNKNSKNKILKTGNIDTHQKEIVPEIHNAMETVWGEQARCPIIYGGMGEMLRNTCDHAFRKKRQTKWHIGISHFEDENMVKFSFVDNGSGIISTYKEKGLLNNLMKYFSNKAEILEEAFKDGITSRTGLKWRGKGLPTIFEMYTDDVIKNLVVITNDVYLDFDRSLIKTLPLEFKGTYYFWVVNSSCKPCYFKI